MSDEIDRLLATGKQKYLNYEVRQPYKVKGLKIFQGLSMMTSQAEYQKPVSIILHIKSSILKTNTIKL